MNKDEHWAWAALGIVALFFSIWLLLHISVGQQPCMTDMECELQHGADDDAKLDKP